MRTEEQITPQEQEKYLGDLRNTYDNLTMPSDLDEIKTWEILEKFRSNLERESSEIREEDKEILTAILTDTEKWVDNLVPQESPQSAVVRIVKEYPEMENAVMSCYKAEIRSFLNIVEKATEEYALPITRGIIAWSLSAKTFRSDPDKAYKIDILKELIGNVEEEEIPKYIQLWERIRELGPVPYEQFVENHFSKINIQNTEEAIKEAQIKAHELSKKRSAVHEDLLKLLDEAETPSNYPKWDKPDLDRTPWGELIKQADPKHDIFTAYRFLERKKSGKEIVRETKQDIRFRKLDRWELRPDGETYEKKAFPGLEVNVYKEEPNEYGSSLVTSTAHRVKYESIEEVYDGIYQLNAAVVMGSGGKEYSLPIRVENGRRFDNKGREVEGSVKFGIPVLSDGIIKRLVVSEKFYYQWRGSLEYIYYSQKELGQKIEPDKIIRKRHTDSQDDEVDRIRQAVLISELADEQLKALSEENASEETVSYFRDSVSNTLEMCRVFHDKYKRLSEYKSLAEERAKKRGLEPHTIEWYEAVLEEVPKISKEMDYMHTAIRDSTTELFYLSKNSENLQDIRDYLMNIDHKIFLNVFSNLEMEHGDMFSYEELRNRVKDLYNRKLSQNDHLRFQGYDIETAYQAILQMDKDKLSEDEKEAKETSIQRKMARSIISYLGELAVQEKSVPLLPAVSSARPVTTTIKTVNNSKEAGSDETEIGVLKLLDSIDSNDQVKIFFSSFFSEGIYPDVSDEDLLPVINMGLASLLGGEAEFNTISTEELKHIRESYRQKLELA